MTQQRDKHAPAPEVVREEAERLVAAGLAAVSMVADRIGAPTRPRGGAAAAGYDALGDMLFGPAHRRHSVANGSEECCRCPVCRVISAVRDPDPGVTEKLTTGVGALAEGAARIARGVADAMGAVWPPRPEPAAPSADRPASGRPAEVDDPWAAATAAAAAEPAPQPPEAAVAPQAGTVTPAATEAAAEKPVAKKAAKQTVAKQAVAKKAVAKKAVAKKAVKKAAPKQTGTGSTPPDAATGDAR